MQEVAPQSPGGFDFDKIPGFNWLKELWDDFSVDKLWGKFRGYLDSILAFISGKKDTQVMDIDSEMVKKTPREYPRQSLEIVLNGPAKFPRRVGPAKVDRELVYRLGLLKGHDEKVSAETLQQRVESKMQDYLFYGKELKMHPELGKRLTKAQQIIREKAANGDDEMKRFIDYMRESVKTKYVGCYCFRRISNSKSMSNHAFGTAIDIAPAENARGKAGKIAGYPNAIKVFESVGLEWGGRWGYRDDMHFQFTPV